ncbi:MAG: EAL domain-containing protein [Plesiomonas sp.]|uniref:EAL domain-containing protein n=1 Tax=Plesiomonas sp. TaxID=2486279 RepID=UPI003F302ACA
MSRKVSWLTSIWRVIIYFSVIATLIYFQSAYSLSLAVTLVLLLMFCASMFSIELFKIKQLAAERLSKLEQTLSAAASPNDTAETKLVAQYAQGWRQEKAELQHRLELIAKDVNRDSLTGLPNRTNFIRQLSLLPEDNAKHWLALIHVAPVHELNQRGGNKLGDLFMQEIAEQLTIHGLPLGQLYRFEGAMFAWVASAHQIDNPERLAERCAQSLEQIAQRHHVNRAANITFVSFYGNQWGAALNHAEESLRIVASLPHRSWQVEYTEQPQIDNWHYELDLQIANADVAFDIQSTLSISETMPKYHELFSRFTFSKGAMSTEKVIAMAEYHGRMAQLDMMLLTKIKAVLNSFKGEGILAVNLGFHTVNDVGFLRWLTHYLEQESTIAKLLVIEIPTEAVQTYPENAGQLINVLHQYGVRVCLCNFGQQLDGLAILSKYKPSFIKLASRYTRDIDADKNTQQVMRLFIDTLHRLGTRVIAENVEKQEDKSALIHLRVDAIQGYVVAKPKSVHHSELLKLVS